MLTLSKSMSLILAGALFSTFACAQTTSAKLTSAKLTTATLNPAVTTGVTTLATTGVTNIKIENLDLLDKIGRYEHPLIVYKAVKPAAADIEKQLSLSKRFAELSGMRFDDSPKKLGDTRLALSGAEDSSASFEVDINTGNFLFEGGLAKYSTEQPTLNLPKEADLQRLAERTLKQFDLPINPSDLKVEHIGGLNLSVADGKNEPKIFEKLKTIRYTRVLNGLPVMGDSRIVMHFGEGAQLSGLIYQIPEVADASDLSTQLQQSPKLMKEQALSELTAMAKKALRAKLTQVDLVVYDDGLGVMEPAYHVVLERMLDLGDKEPVMIPYDFYLPVSSKPVAFFPHMDTGMFMPEEGKSTEGGVVGKAD
ncbi:MAG: hypothetical protein U5M23_10295 [Marinagarivorans sp.]|nr:hypothetical protein [Marinagarivorans sp.]